MALVINGERVLTQQEHRDIDTQLRKISNEIDDAKKALNKDNVDEIKNLLSWIIKDSERLKSQLK